MEVRIPRSPWTRGGIAVAFLAGVGALLWWHGPHWADFKDAFTSVDRKWVAARGRAQSPFGDRAGSRVGHGDPLGDAAATPALRARLLGVLGRAARERGAARPRRRARARRRPHPADDRPPQGLWPTLVGTVFAHRVFDLVPVGILVVWVLATAKIPNWAFTSLAVVLAIGVGLFLFAFATARYHGHTRLEGLGTVRRVVTMARHGLGVMRQFRPTVIAVSGQCAGWTCQLFAVYTAMLAFNIHESLPAAGLVLLLMNVATIVPLWPGNVGLVQAAIALPLVQYGVPYGTGFAFGLGLQAIEASVGVGMGLIFLGREGLSFARLRAMPGAAGANVPESAQAPEEPSEREPASARVSASLKGVLSAALAAEALVRGFAQAGVAADAMPIGDGGEGTLDALCSRFQPAHVADAFGRPRIARTGFMEDGIRVVEAAEAIPLDPSRLDVMAASSHGLGIWIRELEPGQLVVTVGGTATMDAGAGLLEVLGELRGRRACFAT